MRLRPARAGRRELSRRSTSFLFLGGRADAFRIWSRSASLDSRHPASLHGCRYELTLRPSRKPCRLRSLLCAARSCPSRCIIQQDSCRGVMARLLGARSLPGARSHRRRLHGRQEAGAREVRRSIGQPKRIRRFAGLYLTALTRTHRRTLFPMRRLRGVPGTAEERRTARVRPPVENIEIRIVLGSAGHTHHGLGRNRRRRDDARKRRWNTRNHSGFRRGLRGLGTFSGFQRVRRGGRFSGQLRGSTAFRASRRRLCIGLQEPQTLAGTLRETAVQLAAGLFAQRIRARSHGSKQRLPVGAKALAFRQRRRRLTWARLRMHTRHDFDGCGNGHDLDWCRRLAKEKEYRLEHCQKWYRQSLFRKPRATLHGFFLKIPLPRTHLSRWSLRRWPSPGRRAR